MASAPMLWNKARRHQIAFARAIFTGQAPSPGTTWPTAATPTRSRIRQNSVHNPRRPCSTWRPRRCFGTKRGVIQTHSREQPPPAKHHRQVEPGLQPPLRLVAGFARIRFARRRLNSGESSYEALINGSITLPPNWLSCLNRPA